MKKMKLKQRILVGMMLLGMCLVVIMIIPYHTGSPDDILLWPTNKYIQTLEHYSKLTIGRDLNRASRNKSRDLPILMSKIIDSAVFRDYLAIKQEDHLIDKDEDRHQILDALLHNQTFADAMIAVGHILEYQLKKQKTSVQRGLVGAGLHQEQSANVFNITGALQNSRLKSRSSSSSADLILEKGMVEQLQEVLDKMEVQKDQKVHPQFPKLRAYEGLSTRKHRASFLEFHMGIDQHQLYSEDGTVDRLLEDIATKPIIMMNQKSGGTQLKLNFFFEDKSKVVFKPMRFPREQETLPNHFYFSDFERHTAEIAAFHLDRVLGFHRVPPVTGRIINITQNIWKFADSKFEKTFFISPAGNVCFHGQCDYYCDTGHAVCGQPELLEGSFAAYLPGTKEGARTRWRHPWRRSYHKRKKANWETDYEYCKQIRVKSPYNRGRPLLDVMDMAVFDFLQGNLDRHHYETFKDFGNNTFPIILDNGRGFGKASHDEMSILAPIYQCCLLRASTLSTLIGYHTGSDKLSDIMRQSLTKDPVDPVLTESHLLALDRRVATILLVVHDCLTANKDHSTVIINDGF